MATKNINEEDNRDKKNAAVFKELQKQLYKQYQWLIDLPVPNGNFFSEENRVVRTPVTLLSKNIFASKWGVNRVFRLIAQSGELLVYRGTSKLDKKVGDKFVLSVRIKAHYVFKGENQTHIKNIRLVKNL